MTDSTYTSTSPARTPPDHVGILIASLILMVVGWGGLYQLVTTTLPRVGQRWLFFVLLHIAVSATVLPFIRYLNIRFRQSVWVGVFAVTCAWLQIPRVLSLPTAFFLALALIVIEVFLRSRELALERE
jgi:CDP-diglyceride synthetase